MKKSDLQKMIEDFDLLTVVNSLAPSYDSIQKEVEEIQTSFPTKSKKEYANIFGNRLKRRYTSVGVVSALPSTIPGVGTAVQIAMETGAISTDLAFMIRWMAGTCYGVALIYEKDIQSDFNQEFVKVLGLWCGAIHATKIATEKIATKVAVVQFNKNVSGKVLQAINRKVGVTLLTKYGTKRGGIAIGRLIPFGVGAVIGGTFNYVTMNQFKKQAIKYFQTDESTDYAIYSNA